MKAFRVPKLKDTTEGQVEDFLEKFTRLTGKNAPEFQLHAMEEDLEGPPGQAVFATCRNEIGSLESTGAL